MLFDANVGMNDVLNQIIWMSSVSDIMDTLIATGVGAVIFVVLFGVVQCFFGYKVFRFELGVLGAAGLGLATYMGCRFLLHYSGGKLIAWTAFAAFMGAGMLFTVSAIIVFLTTLVGTTIALVLGSTANGWDMLPQVILVLALGAAVISVIFYRHVIIIGNVIIGAGMIGLIINSLFESALMGTVIGVLFGICGLVTQYWMYISGNRKRREREQEEEVAELAKQTRVVDDTITGVPQVESTDINYAELFPSQQEVEQKLILQDVGLKPREIEEQLERTREAVHTATSTVTAMETAAVSETGTISAGELRSKMKRL